MSQDLIVLVEDDRDIREVLADTLQAEGFAVVTATNGLDALEVLRGLPTPPSVILLDLMMPVMDGYGFLAERRKDPALASVPVVVITASHRVDRGQVDDDTPIIAKPIDLPSLLIVLDELGVRPGAPG